ncbi:hypothetical protein FD42_GL001151 [Lentilactobacillus hilgardii DSM 20176 = ATCC 8290]|nr:hypothetical protein FD42_GL001151 [Lentilactobacillus hilgardii DSM 20176 = ATCC 8290]
MQVVNKKIGKAIWTVVILACFSLLIYLTIFDRLPKGLDSKKIVTVFSLTTTLVIYGYNHWKFLFVYWRKFCACLWGDTVSWTGKYVFYLDAEQDFVQLAKEFRKKVLNQTDVTCEDGKIQKDSANFTFNFKGLQNKIKIERSSANDYDEIVLKYSSSTSYRDSKKQVENFQKIIKKLSAASPQQIDLSKFRDSQGLKERLSVTISMRKYNPFYRLTLRHFDGDEGILKWNMVLTEDDLKVEIKKHMLRATSSNEEKIIDVLKNYIALSTVG